MISDTERREVAENLRYLADYPGAPVQYAEQLRDELYGTVFSDGLAHDCSELFTRLADLIEPSDGNAELCAHCDYRDYCDLPKCSEQDGYSFKPKGYVDLLVLADKISETARPDMEICGDTVPAWYAAGRLEAVAYSIREILGVER